MGHSHKGAAFPMMILQDFSPTALVKGIEENLYEYVKLYGVLDDAELYDAADMLRLRTPSVPNPFFNSILRARLPLLDIDAQLDAILAPYFEALLPVMWWVGSTTQPEDLGQRLRSRGFYLEQMPGMAVHLAKLPAQTQTPPSFYMERVQNEALLRVWIKVNATPYDFLDYINDAFFTCYCQQGFDDRAALRHYVGWLDDTPVACSTLFLGAGVAGIYSVATLPEARRQGIGSAMTLYPLLEAQAEGFQIGVLSATRMGVSIYEKMGFQAYCKTNMYVYY
jgi:ribosomal protein S18 acetylase RimI-like enzyme